MLELTSGEIGFYHREGYLLIPGLLGEQQAADLREEVMDLMRAIGGYEGNKLKQSAEYKADSHLDRFINSPQLRGLASQLMKGDSSLYLPFTAVKGVGGGTFHFHQDNNYTRFEDGMLGINLWFALAPMSPDNGCLQIVPRSHLRGTLESEFSPDGDIHKKVKYEPADFLPVRMRPGDCIAFTRLTIHGSGPNRSGEPRVAYALQYHRNDARWIDRETGEKKLLTEFPRYVIKPVEEYSVPTGTRDGHRRWRAPSSIKKPHLGFCRDGSALLSRPGVHVRLFRGGLRGRFGILHLLRHRSLRHRFPRAPWARCACGFDLRSSPERCPECGRPVLAGESGL